MNPQKKFENHMIGDELYEVFLTGEGKEVAKNTLQKNQMFRKLLTELGVDEKTAAADACEMEHAVSAESFEALMALTVKKNGGEAL